MQKQDIYFLQEAFRVARELSQDANTQTGAVIVNRIGRMISAGSNRMNYYNRKMLKEPAVPIPRLFEYDVK